MINKIKRYMLIAATILTVSGTGASFMPSMAFACTSNIATEVANGAGEAIGNGTTITCGTVTDTTTIATIAADIVNIFSIIVGAAAVIMIIYAGFRYITSGGSSDKVGGAKNSLIYAIIGLVIVAVAQLIVHFVLNEANNIGT